MKRKKIWISLIICFFSTSLWAEILTLEQYESDTFDAKGLASTVNSVFEAKVKANITVSSNSKIKYYETYERSGFPLATFTKKLSMNDIKNNNYYGYYQRVIYNKNKLIESHTMNKKGGVRYKRIFDKKGRLIEIYDFADNSMMFFKKNDNQSMDYILCDINKTVCSIYNETQKEASQYTGDGMKYYPEFPNKLLRGDQYIELINKEKLEKESKIIFDKILKEENEESTKMKIKYFSNYKIESKKKYTIKFVDPIGVKKLIEKSNYFKVYFKDNKPLKAKEFNSLNVEKPIKTMKLDSTSRFTHVVDFKTREISDYNYNTNVKNKITCKYREGVCYIIKLSESIFYENFTIRVRR
jgi:hypothetical protein